MYTGYLSLSLALSLMSYSRICQGEVGLDGTKGERGEPGMTVRAYTFTQSPPPYV